MKTIKLKCRCGADFEYIDSEDSFASKDLPFRHNIDKVASDWLDRHQVCIEPPKADRPDTGKVPWNPATTVYGDAI